jgi:hypothetical protein
MKALKNFDNTDKLKVLHELFPDEIPQLLDDIQEFCTHFLAHKEDYAKDWNIGFMPFDYWLSLSEQTAELIKKYHFNMVKSSRVFSDQLTYTYAVLFVNDRIVKYADEMNDNSKFKKAVNLLFKA